MKTISILQPWASLVVLGHKKIETRSWNTKYRGELLIHASMGKQYKKIGYGNPLLEYYTELYENGMIEHMASLSFGAIIGKVNLEAVIPSENIDASGDPFQQSMLINSDRTKFASNCATISLQEYAFGDYSDGRFGWLLSDPILFKEPIPCKGQLGIWNLPNELLNDVKSQLLQEVLTDKEIEEFINPTRL